MNLRMVCTAAVVLLALSGMATAQCSGQGGCGGHESAPTPAAFGFDAEELPNGLLFVTFVAENGHAAKAGLRQGDVVVAVAGRPMQGDGMLLRGLAAGGAVPIRVLRGSGLMDLGAQPRVQARRGQVRRVAERRVVVATGDACPNCGGKKLQDKGGPCGCGEQCGCGGKKEQPRGWKGLVRVFSDRGHGGCQGRGCEGGCRGKKTSGCSCGGQKAKRAGHCGQCGGRKPAMGHGSCGCEGGCRGKKMSGCSCGGHRGMHQGRSHCGGHRGMRQGRCNCGGHRGMHQGRSHCGGHRGVRQGRSHCGGHRGMHQGRCNCGGHRGMHQGRCNCGGNRQMGTRGPAARRHIFLRLLARKRGRR